MRHSRHNQKTTTTSVQSLYPHRTCQFLFAKHTRAPFAKLKGMPSRQPHHAPAARRHNTPFSRAENLPFHADLQDVLLTRRTCRHARRRPIHQNSKQTRHTSKSRGIPSCRCPRPPSPLPLLAAGKSASEGRSPPRCPGAVARSARASSVSWCGAAVKQAIAIPNIRGNNQLLRYLPCNCSRASNSSKGNPDDGWF